MNWLLLKNSLMVATLTTLMASCLGFLAALWMTGLSPRWRNCVLGLAVMALALPPFLVTNCWLHFLGAAGVWRSWLPLNVVSLGGTTWILSLLTWPIAMFAAGSAWRRLEPSQLESDVEVTGWWLIGGLLLPLARTALAQAAVLTFVLALNNFAVPAILQVKVFPAEIWVRFNTTFDTVGALRLSWPLAAGPLLLLLWFSRSDISWPRMESPVPARLFRRQLGAGWFWFCGAGGIMICLLSVGLPLLQLVCVPRTWTELPGALAAGQGALWNSVFLAALSATIILALSLWSAPHGRETHVSLVAQTCSLREASRTSGLYRGFPIRKRNDVAASLVILTPHRHAKPCRLEVGDTVPRFGTLRASYKSALRDRRAPVVRPMALSIFNGRKHLNLFGCMLWLPLLVPGVLLGIALIVVFNRPGLALFYQSAGIVILAFVIRYLGLGWNTVAQARRAMDRDLSDAALLSGATRWQMLRYVHWPQIAPQAAAAWYVVFLLCLWDVESMILVTPPGGETLALRVFNLLHYGHNAQVNALCLTLLAVAVAPLAAWQAYGVVRRAWRRS